MRVVAVVIVAVAAGAALWAGLADLAVALIHHFTR